jgi:hypothetical protein
MDCASEKQRLQAGTLPPAAILAIRDAADEEVLVA